MFPTTCRMISFGAVWNRIAQTPARKSAMQKKERIRQEIFPVAPCHDPVVQPDQSRRKRCEEKNIAPFAERIQAKQNQQNIREHPQVFRKQRCFINYHERHAERRIQEKSPRQETQENVERRVNHMPQISENIAIPERRRLETAVPTGISHRNMKNRIVAQAV